MRIVIHCGSGGPNYPWGPDSIGQGIGGSEESVIYLSQELAALGHEVAVINRLPEDRRIHGINQDGVGWMGLLRSPLAIPYDIFIAWRDWRLFNQAPASARKYLWCHDWPVDPHWNPEVAEHFDRIILLNEHHARQYEAAGCPREKMFICNNGVDLAQFDQQVERIPGKCIYFSHPHRGLPKLREYWPKIREAVPHATLHAFWWEPEFFLPPNEALGIMPMRSLGHMELAREILSSELLTYPSVFSPEINPITCIKSQVGGAVPVVVLQGGMGNTLIDEFMVTSSHDRYAETVITCLTTHWDDFRSRMMAAARKKFDWKEVARAWSAEFEKEIVNG